MLLRVAHERIQDYGVSGGNCVRLIKEEMHGAGG